MQLALLVAAFAVCSPVLQAAWPEAEAGPSARPIYSMKERCTVSFIARVLFGMRMHVLCPSSPQSGYHACTYRYQVTQRNFDGAELQVTKVQAIVRVGCSSGELASLLPHSSTPSLALICTLYWLQWEHMVNRMQLATVCP